MDNKKSAQTNLSVANTLSKEYGQLHPRLELKNETEDEVEEEL
jgi:hypothetical protein